MRPRGALEVIVFLDRRFVGSEEFTEPLVTIGGAAGAMVRLEGEGIAAEHAVVHFTGRTCVIEDQGTQAGTFCSGERVDSHLVQPNEEIAIGRYTLRFVIHQAQAAAAPVATIQAPEKPPQTDNSGDKLQQKPPATDAFHDEPQQKQIQSGTSNDEPQQSRFQSGTSSDEPQQRPPETHTSNDELQQRPPETHLSSDEHPQSPPATHLSSDEHPQSPPSSDEPPQESLPTAPASHFVRAERDDDDDDEDDEEARFVPSFSLLSRLRDHGEVPPASGAVVQAVFARDGRVREIVHLLPGERLPIDGAPGAEGRFEAPGRFGLAAGDGARLALRRRGEPAFADADARAGGLHLEPGDAATLRFGARGDEVLVHFVPRTAALPPAAARLRPDRTLLAFAVATVVFHAGAWGVVGAMGNERIAVATSDDPTAGRFALIEMKDPLMEAPKAKKEPPKKSTVKPKPRPQDKLPALPQPPPPPMPQLPESLRRFVNKTAAPRSAGASNPNLSAKSNQLLSSLNIGPSATAAAAATNLNAVTGAAPNAGGFHVGGTIGKLPEGGLKLGAAGSGVGRIETRSAGDVTQGGKLGRLAGSAGSGAVRGQVKSAPARAVEVQGELDRGEIQKVVSGHMHEVQGCYERRLIKDPSLHGKVVMEWQVMPVGMVGVVRVKFSDLKDPEVASCIQMSVRLWRFPQPKGGAVTITYPFVFSTIGP